MKINELKKIAYEEKSKMPRLIICGGGHVGYCVAYVGKMLDFDITVIDDREAFANHERFPEVKCICAPFGEAVANIPSDESTYFVITTRGHATDYQCLKEVISKPSAYIGMLGSKRKIKLLMDQLLKEGVDEAVLKKVYTPIGLEIGAQTPSEISISIMAELIQVKSRKGQAVLLNQELIECILKDQAHVIARITEQHGSAPRGVGAMMILKKDGSIIGTIGGGRVEKDVTERIKQLALGKEKQDFYYAMNHKAEEKGQMICGGAVNVAIERVDYE